LPSLVLPRVWDADARLPQFTLYPVRALLFGTRQTLLSFCFPGSEGSLSG
jgi:hypothetical protein